MNAQRLRNLTTGILHTKMEDIYEDIEKITGCPGIMTHQIPAAHAAILPFLKDKIKDKRFWNDKYDTKHDGEIDIPSMNDEEKAAMFKIFGKEIRKLWSK